MYIARQTNRESCMCIYSYTVKIVSSLVVSHDGIDGTTVADLRWVELVTFE